MPDHGLGRNIRLARAWPQPNNMDRRTPDAANLSAKPLTTGWLQKSQGSCQVRFTPYGTSYRALFTILFAISTTTAQTSRSQDGLVYASEPPTLASVLCLVKIQDKGVRHPPPDQRQQPGQGSSRWPYYYKGSGSPPVNNYDNTCTHGFPPCSYKGSPETPRDREQHFTICPHNRYWH